MLNDFIDPQGSLYLGDKVRDLIPFIQKKIVEAKFKGEPVIFHYYTHSEKDNPFKLQTLAPLGSVPGTWGAAIVPELEPQSQDTVVGTPEGSLSYNAKMDEILIKEQVDQVMITGILTYFHITQIVMGLLAKGFRVEVFRQGFQEILFRDGVASIVENPASTWNILAILGVKVT